MELRAERALEKAPLAGGVGCSGAVLSPHRSQVICLDLEGIRYPSRGLEPPQPPWDLCDSQATRLHCQRWSSWQMALELLRHPSRAFPGMAEALHGGLRLQVALASGWRGRLFSGLLEARPGWVTLIN